MKIKQSSRNQDTLEKLTAPFKPELNWKSRSMGVSKVNRLLKQSKSQISVQIPTARENPSKVSVPSFAEGIIT